MPDFKMTRKEFFKEFKNIVSRIEDSTCAAEWLKIADTVTDDDFEKGDEVITVDPDDMNRLGRNAFIHSDAFAENIEINMYFGLKHDKFTQFGNFGYMNVRSGLTGFIGEATGRMYDRLEELGKIAGQTDFRRTDDAYDYSEWLRDTFEACDKLGIVDNAYTLKFYSLSANGEKKTLNAKEIGEAFSAGNVVYAQHKDFADIPLIKNENGKVVSGDELINRPAFEPQPTEIPQVTGIWNRICRLLHIKTAGTRAYFEAKDLEKARRLEADKKNADLRKAKEHIENEPKFQTAKVMNINKESEILVKKAEEAHEKNVESMTSVLDEKVNKWMEGLEEAITLEENKDVGEIRVYMDEARRFPVQPYAAHELLAAGNTLYASGKNASKAYKFNLLGKDGSLAFDKDADKAIENAEETKKEEFETVKRKAVGNVVDAVSELSEYANGAPIRRHGENRRDWQEKALINLRTNKDYQISKLAENEKEELRNGLDEWLASNRQKLVTAYETLCRNGKKRAVPAVKEYLEKDLNGKTLLDVIESKQKEYSVKYADPKRMEKVNAILEERKEKEESYKAKETEKSLEGQKIVEAERAKAYEVISDTKATPKQVSGAIATIIACHTLSAKTALESDIISRNNGGAEMQKKIDENKAQSIKAREIISKNPKAFTNAVESVKGTDAFKYYESELERSEKEFKEKGIKSYAFFREQRGKLASRGIVEKNVVGGDIAPLKADTMAAESKLITAFDQKNKDLSLEVGDIVKTAVKDATEKNKEVDAPSVGTLEKK